MPGLPETPQTRHCHARTLSIGSETEMPQVSTELLPAGIQGQDGKGHEILRTEVFIQKALNPSGKDGYFGLSIEH